VGVILYLYYSEGTLPVFDLGVLTMLITAVYSAIPLLGFWLAGLRWSTTSYLPLYLWQPDAAEVGRFSLRHVLYLYTFTLSYVWFRGRTPIQPGPTRELKSTALVAMAVIGVALIGYFWILEEVFDLSYDPTYTSTMAESMAESARRVPYVLLQASHNLFAMLFLLKLCALVWLMSHWRSPAWRAVLLVWLGYEGLSTVFRMGARTWFVMLMMASVLLYHRLVRPLPFLRAALLVVLVLAGVITYGVARDLGGRGGLSNLQALSQAGPERWATMNEFQAIYGIAYDLHARKQEGFVGRIPWQIYTSDLTLLVPSQLLPFPKADPCVGYPIVEGTGLGCVLGVVAQAIVGLDWIELVLRGLVLGVLFAVIHRWYLRRHDDYWATLFYLCLCLWCYYTFRASTFYFTYYIVYRFVPLLIGVRLVQLLVRRAHRFATACGV
jgi:hypothetical protein